MNVPISLPQIDALDGIKAGLDSVTWMCYMTFCDSVSDDSDDANKTAKSVYLLLEPWCSRLGDVLEEIEQARRECKELKAKEAEDREKE